MSNVSTMSTHAIATALARVEGVLRRRPEAGLHDDAPATAVWAGQLRMRCQHANGRQVPTDMPCELGGGGEEVTPGWLFRAGLASCAATSIVLAAAAEQIELTALEVRASSRSDTRALLGIPDENGGAVPPAPGGLQLAVRIDAEGVPFDRLRELVERAVGRSPIPGAATHALPLALQVTQAGGSSGVD
jgi:uncharacterized OsmC-like protein